jgi:hypothetical protein
MTADAHVDAHAHAEAYRTGRIVHLAARFVAIVVVVIVGVTLLVWGGRGFPDLPMSFMRSPAGFLLLAVVALTFTLVGAFLSIHLPRHAVGWLLILAGAGVALHMPVSVVVGEAVSSFRPMSTGLLAAIWLLTSAFVPLVVGVIAFLLMLLPDGRFESPRWRYGAAVTVVGFHVLMTATALEPSGLLWFPTLPNPLAVPASLGPAVVALRLAGVALLVTGLALAAWSMVRRYRRGDATTRQQLRWVAAGAVIWTTTLAPFLVVRYLLGASEEVGSMVVLVAATGTIAIPLSIFVATTRHHLFGVQAILGRTLVYVPLMAICAGLYAGGLALSQRLFVAFTGNTSDVAIIVSTLLAAAAITPAKRLLETGVDRLVASARATPTTTASVASPPVDPAGADVELLEEEYRELSREHEALTERMLAVEQRLAAVEPRPRDRSLECGEPGVGRAFARPEA